jgi:hypothetical protein
MTRCSAVRTQHQRDTGLMYRFSPVTRGSVAPRRCFHRLFHSGFGKVMIDVLKSKKAFSSEGYGKSYDADALAYLNSTAGAARHNRIVLSSPEETRMLPS